MMSKLSGIRQLANSLMSGQLTSVDLAERACQAAMESSGIFTELDESLPDKARKIDQERLAGQVGPLAGIPVSLKDLYNVQGQKTLAGSRVLKDTAPVESRDAVVVSSLREAGFLFLGRTNMSEFAFSGMGINPHHPPIYSIWDRETGRLPGGSSSGSAVSVALGIVPGTLGSDTAGSCRIPAAFNGIVGMKPSYGRLSLEGIYPLSPTSDAPGPLGVDVDTCFLLDHVMSGGYRGGLPALTPPDPKQTTLLIPDGVVMSDLDPEVSRDFTRAIERLEVGGMTVKWQTMPVIDDSVEMFLQRPVVPYEAWQSHAEKLESRGDEYDPYVRQRMMMGRHVKAEDQEDRYAEKTELARRFAAAFQASAVSAIIYPTVVCVPPPVSSIQEPEKTGPVNLRCLRNTAAVNYLDGCAISLPCHQEGDAPVGLMLTMPHGHDRQLYDLASRVEHLLGNAH